MFNFISGFHISTMYSFTKTTALLELIYTILRAKSPFLNFAIPLGTF